MLNLKLLSLVVSRIFEKIHFVTAALQAATAAMDIGDSIERVSEYLLYGASTAKGH